jgi:hypothetical protein
MATPTTFTEMPSARTAAGDRVPRAPESHVGAALLFLMGAFWPRFFIVGFWIFSDLLGDAYSSWVIPALGFLILPWTTLSYAFAWGLSSDSVSGLEWPLVALGLLLDVATWAAATRLRK